MRSGTTRASFENALPALAAVAAVETLRAKLTPDDSILIAACRHEVVALALSIATAVAVGGALLLLSRARPLRRLRAPVVVAAAATWPALFALAYMAFHDVKYDVLGPFPSRPLVHACRAAIALGTLLFTLLLASLAARAPRALFAVTIALLLAAPLVASVRNRPGPAAGPAVLLVTIDTLRADHVGAYGKGLPITPHLDRLARSGQVRELAICQIPITTPSHACILTGRYPPGHAVRGQAYSMSRDVPTVSAAMRSAGITTAAFVAAYPLDSKFGLDRGFDVYDDELQGTTAYEQISLWRLAMLLGPIPQVERPAAAVDARVAPWLGRHGRERYFLWTHYFDPHGPYVPVEPFRSFYLDRCRELLPSEPPADEAARAALRDVLPPGASDGDIRTARLAYGAEIAEVDRALGELLARARKARATPGDLTIVVMSDHGESLTEHGAYFRHGEDLYEPSLRIPLVMAGPSIPAASLDTTLTETIDVTPILADALAVPWPQAPPRPAGFAESTSAAVHYTPRKVLGVRTPTRKLVRGASDTSTELFDLVADPGELDDVSRRRPDVVDELGKLLDTYAATAAEEGDPFAADQETIDRLRSLGYLK